MSARHRPAAAVAAAWLLLLAACGGGADETAQPAGATGDAPVRGGTMVLGSISDVDNWNPYISGQSFAHDVLRRIYLELARQQSPSGDVPPSFEPQLAESWSMSEDGLSITFKLRDAAWSDGAPLRAQDVRFTWEAQTSPQVAWTSVGIKRHVRDVEVLDERTVAFRFDRRYPHQLTDALEGPILPQHVFGRIPFEDWRTHDWSKARVGSGPFLPEHIEPRQEITLARNPRYYLDGFPRLDRVVVRIVPDSGNLLTQLLSGGLDYMEISHPRQIQRVPEDAGFTLTPYDQPKYDFIGWNGAREPLDDPEVRRALTLAIDREAIVEDLLYGYGKVSQGPVLSFWWALNRELAPMPADPPEARRLLAARGFRPGRDGILERDGRPFRLGLITNSGNPLRESVVVKVQEQLRQVGVDVDVQLMDLGALRRRVGGGDYDGWLGGWVFTGRVDLEPLFASGSMPPHGMNLVSYRSPEVDALLERLHRAADWTEVKAILDVVQVELHRDQPYTFLYESQRIAVGGPRLRGVTVDLPFDPLARLERYWVEP